MLNKVSNCFGRCHPKARQHSTEDLRQLLEESKRKRTTADREEYEKKYGKPKESKIIKMLLENGT